MNWIVLFEFQNWIFLLVLNLTWYLLINYYSDILFRWSDSRIYNNMLRIIDCIRKTSLITLYTTETEKQSDRWTDRWTKWFRCLTSTIVALLHLIVSTPNYKCPVRSNAGDAVTHNVQHTSRQRQKRNTTANVPWMANNFLIAIIINNERK